MFRPALVVIVAALGTPPAAAQSWHGERSPMPPRPTVTTGGMSFPQLAQTARSAAGGGTYIGGDFDHETGTYRFKFINNGRVTWVDVDGRSGQVVNVEGR